MADYVDKKFYKLNATTASTKDIHEITSNTDTLLGYKGVVIYIDEIQHFSKKQQQSLLEFMENGKVTLIASTTENPYFAIHKAIISRCNIFKFEPLTSKDIYKGLLKTIDKISIIDFLSKLSFIKSKSEARRLIQQGGIEIDNKKINDINKILVLNKGKELIEKKKKKTFVKVIIE